MALPQILEWFTLTEMVNEFKSPNAFIRNLVFGNVRTLTTENIVYRIQEKLRKIAPFSVRGREAIMSGGYDEREVNFTAPNIRIKRPLDAVDLLFRRHAGDQIFAGADTVRAAAEREIALQLQSLNDEVSNGEEWLAAQAIRGLIDYVSEDEAAFTVDMKRPAANNIVLGTFWDQVGAQPLTDTKLVKLTMHGEVQLNPMVAILGSDACDVFLQQTEIQRLLDIRRMRVGLVDGTQDVDELGAMPLGNWGGIDYWGYTREVEVNGVSEPLVRPKFAEFLNVSPAAMHTMYYAAIPDLDAFEGGSFVGRRFSKSWRQPDPSEQQILVHSRPLPIMRRPGSSVSMQIVS